MDVTDVTEWSKSEIDYGKKLLNSGLEGARSGQEEFLQGTPINAFLDECLRHAWLPTVVGGCIGLLAGRCLKNRSADKVVALGAIGALTGFVARMTWESRHLTESVTSGALKNINKVRDEHWLEKHPIDYA